MCCCQFLSPKFLFWRQPASGTLPIELNGVVDKIVLMGLACESKVAELETWVMSKLCRVPFPNENIAGLDVSMYLCDCYCLLSSIHTQVRTHQWPPTGYSCGSIALRHDLGSEERLLRHFFLLGNPSCSLRALFRRGVSTPTVPTKCLRK